MRMVLVLWARLAAAEPGEALPEPPGEVAVEPERKRPPETGKGAWKGAGEGFLYGAAGGIVLSTFSPWHLENGSLVNVYVHSGVDLLIIGVEGAVVGAVIAARKPKSLLEPSRLHLSLAVGYGDLLAQKFLKQAYTDSGYAWHTEWWFGRPHWPRGHQVASPYAWAATADFSILPRVQVGLAFHDFTRQRVGAMDADVESFADGWTAGALGTWVIDPIGTGRDRFEWAVGLGVGMSYLVEGGSVGGDEYRVARLEPTAPFRVSVDWYATPRTSLQLKVATRMHFPLEVPEQNGGGEPALVAHSVNFTSFDLVLGVRAHLFERDR